MYLYFYIKACQHILLHKIVIFLKSSYDPFSIHTRFLLYF